MYKGYGRVIKSNGGLFTVRLFDRTSEGERGKMPLDGCTVTGRGRGALHRKGALLVGDLVEVSYDGTAFSQKGNEILPAEDGAGLALDAITARKNALIRPPMANLDVIFVTFAAASPDPILETVDKLICIAEFNRIEPIVVITKSELNPTGAVQMAQIYRNAGFEAFCTGLGMEAELDTFKQYINTHLNGKIAAFSGASGVGKSTLLNRLFPQLHLETGEISRRIERGKNTTRCVELYPLAQTSNCGYLADTPGFTMLDFERFDFFEKEDLPLTFREFVPHIGTCRYTKCSHTKEEGCAILAAVKNGEIASSRHQSFLSLYEILKKKTKW
ncbi:MAG: ribosome small subunit-dependent GTPase A [Clostridia bacterium]|nr:ribosome small subunit-dependent GTPase A [Clostridia bacterium]